MEQKEYQFTTNYVEPGKAPGMKVKLLSTLGDVRTYMIIFSKGDEAVSGLTEFAEEYDVKSAHFLGIGSAFSLELGWFDFEFLKFQVIPVGIAEVTSFMGNITWYEKKPIVHAHATASVRDGSVKGGHLMAMNVGPTFEIIITVEPTPLYKKLNEEFQAGIIDFEMKS